MLLAFPERTSGMRRPTVVPLPRRPTMVTSPSSIRARSRIPSKPSDLTPEGSRAVTPLPLSCTSRTSLPWLAQSYIHPRRPGVPGDVGESFLKNAEGGGCVVLAQRDVLQLGNEEVFVFHHEDAGLVHTSRSVTPHLC